MAKYKRIGHSQLLALQLASTLIIIILWPVIERATQQQYFTRDYKKLNT